MSVLKDKRTTSKAEYVNVANQIYVKTVDFLSRVSPRYSRLIAADTAHQMCIRDRIKATVGTGTRILKQSGKADNLADAERKIQAAVDSANHGHTTISMTRCV